MKPSNTKWYTLFTKNAFTGTCEVFAMVKGEGNANLLIHSLRPVYGDQLRSIEGKHPVITDQDKARFYV